LERPLVAWDTGGDKEGMEADAPGLEEAAATAAWELAAGPGVGTGACWCWGGEGASGAEGAGAGETRAILSGLRRERRETRFTFLDMLPSIAGASAPEHLQCRTRKERRS
jgi:hypothetical protein